MVGVSLRRGVASSSLIWVSRGRCASTVWPTAVEGGHAAADPNVDAKAHEACLNPFDITRSVPSARRSKPPRSYH